jgi:hypothetical protein
VIAAAMTPVIVAIVKEMLARPMESELVRKPVRQVSRIASTRRAVPTGDGGRVERARAATRGTGDPLVPSPPPPRTEPRGVRRDYGPGNGNGPTPGDPELSPMRTYGRGRRRPVHLKAALVTGLVAFLIAAAALTLPELLFGGAISSRHDTTLFGGGGSSKPSQQKNNGKGTSTQPSQQKPSNQQTTPAAPPSTSGSKTPTTSTPAPTSPQQSPQQTTPQQTSPVPTTPGAPVPKP